MSAESKPTPGPYEAFYLVGGEHEIRAPQAANCVVADISCGHQYIGIKGDNHNITEAEATANADLFAAAPELLKACESFMWMITTKMLVRDISRDHEADWALKMVHFTQRLQEAHAAIAKATPPSPPPGKE